MLKSQANVAPNLKTSDDLELMDEAPLVAPALEDEAAIVPPLMLGPAAIAFEGSDTDENDRPQAGGLLALPSSAGAAGGWRWWW